MTNPVAWRFEYRFAPADEWQTCYSAVKPKGPDSHRRNIVPLYAAAPKVASDTGAITPEWCLRMADLEAGQEIGAGSLDHPLRTKCELPPAGWVCTREPGHDGPCAAVASGIGAGLLREARWYVNDALEAHEHSDGRDLLKRIDAALATPTDATDGATGGGEVGTGWVSWNPDSGEEYTPDHPVRSGECVEAERIRPSTPQEDVLWQAFQGEFERAHALETQLAATTPGGDLLEQAASVPTDKQVREAMQDAWDNFCDDAQAIPGDIRREGRKTFFVAGTWADHTAMNLRAIMARALKPAGDGGEA